MKSTEKREIYFFSRLAKSIYEDAVSNADEAVFRGSFQQHHDLISSWIIA